MKNFGILAALLVASNVIGSAQGQHPVPVLVGGGTETKGTAIVPNSNSKLEIVGGDTFDWKKVKPKDTPIKAKIKIINTGTELLTISDVRPGCSCTAAPLDKKELRPLVDTATMEVSINLGATSGPLNKTITILSNDGSSPNKILYLKADVIREINITPSPYFAFRDMIVGKTSEASVRLENNSDKDIVINESSATNGIELNLKPGTVIKSKTQMEVIARVTPKISGYFTATAKIMTSHSDFAIIDLTSYGTVKDVIANPPSAK